MALLQEEQPHVKVYEAMDIYFPEREPEPHPKATAQDLELVQAAQENFRDLVFGLLKDRREREKYVQEHLENDYGEAFSQVVEDLFCDYLIQLENTLPEPDFQQCSPNERGQPRPPLQTPVFIYAADTHGLTAAPNVRSLGFASSAVRLAEHSKSPDEGGLFNGVPARLPSQTPASSRNTSPPWDITSKDSMPSRLLPTGPARHPKVRWRRRKKKRKRKDLEGQRLARPRRPQTGPEEEVVVFWALRQRIPAGTSQAATEQRMPRRL
ncbi:hypothetical protein JRQ81_004439 [Phrynocephalus forsythii]|uniref:TERF1-interacting nuclear factor 2 N-terminal domain-containing protein n=1 Tax=Phrynocephalus forsythii TaxID=171643 RepID=A0A9Q0XIH5_9SAUR|nr:hypothetical protein JRQ81_004439 [Phrynocephalus forsythii]